MKLYKDKTNRDVLKFSFANKIIVNTGINYHNFNKFLRANEGN